MSFDNIDKWYEVNRRKEEFEDYVPLDVHKKLTSGRERGKRRVRRNSDTER